MTQTTTTTEKAASSLEHALYLSLHRKQPNNNHSNPLTRLYLDALASLDPSSSSSSTTQPIQQPLSESPLFLFPNQSHQPPFSLTAAAHLSSLVTQIEVRRRALVATAKNINTSKSNLKHVTTRINSLIEKSSPRLEARLEFTLLALKRWILAVSIAAPPSSSAFKSSTSATVSSSSSKTRTCLNSDDLPFSARLSGLALDWILEREKCLVASAEDRVELKGVEKFVTEVPWDHVLKWIREYVYNDHDFSNDLTGCMEALEEEHRRNLEILALKNVRTPCTPTAVTRSSPSPSSSAYRAEKENAAQGGASRNQKKFGGESVIQTSGAITSGSATSNPKKRRLPF
ncbi:hypothetical protein BCR33DRAFT_720116 [Rhizoclosmatium globosum]|uniref:Uncharacterized protein n=1 Tax=Rhizoclosmatium globosum TaxID=329046 RepID=A0A1Y2BX11_9FUNG|nr:hypothetical protein BCR33DRAFT_720116 [Rhizoclosmatium globosum]|eukprot:ORY39278.1 hypothetical protein BCR33DRAFT_720116 [Rhizoclosmatium globosum]